MVKPFVKNGAKTSIADSCTINHLKMQTKLPRVRNPKSCLQYACSLVCDVIDFIYDLKLFKAINKIYSDNADSLTTIPPSVNYAVTKDLL